jgi:heme-degrading monooxygenase HmoA
MEQGYLVSVWRVIEGQEEAFRAAWRDLAQVFVASAHPAFFGVLLQHDTDRTLFYSFGPWASMADVEAMRRSPEAQDAFLRVTSLCDDAQTGAYQVAEFVNRPRQGAAVQTLPRETVARGL